MKKDVLDAGYLGFGGLMSYLLVAEIDWTPWDIILEKLEDKKISSGFMHIFTRKK